MTEKEYRTLPGISRSELWKLRESPEKFKYYQEHPEPPTKTLIFGAAVHKLLLEPETFDQEFAVAPECNRQTKAGREAYNAFLSASDGKSVITLLDYKNAMEMTRKALKAPFVRKLLNGEHEKPFFWTDEMTEEDCKCRTDILTEVNGKLTIVDYKTGSSAQTDAFNKAIWAYGYHLQVAMYTEGVMHNYDLTERPDFIFIVQEKKPPYSLNVVTIPDEIYIAGIDVFREYMGIYHTCKETGYWYGYTGPFDAPNEAYLPGWMMMGGELEEITEGDKNDS